MSAARTTANPMAEDFQLVWEISKALLNERLYFYVAFDIEYLLMLELDNTNQTAPVAEAVPQGPSIDPLILEEMVKAGVLYGRKKTKTHPKMKPFIFTTRNGIEILDLPKTMQALEKAAEFWKEVAKKGGLILVVGTKPAAQELTENFAKKFSISFVIKRWLGGTLTNFKTISKRIQYYMNLKSDKATGKLEKYTKKERVEFDKEIERLNGFFVGLERLARLPDVLVIINANEHITAIREAKRLKIPIVAILSTDTDPELANYPIPANDNSKTSIAWILGKLEAKIEEGARERPVASPITKS